MPDSLETCPTHSARRGFTLVELLITITIIGILAGISLGALSAARQTARASKTKSTIVKLDRIVMAKYESYRTRRVPIDTSGMQPIAAARVRLDAIRDLIRLEMPERWNDVLRNPAWWPGALHSMSRPSLSLRFLQKYNSNNPTDEFGPAECLYMFVSTDPEARAQFNESEIGDADNDGWPEFHDGWDRPIMFLRWAPEFVSSDIQPAVVPAGDAAAIQRAAQKDHDPFDTRQMDPNAYHLTPLIYSGGPDKEYDIELNGAYEYAGNPYAGGAGATMGNGHDQDNIHNHNIEQR